MNTTIRLDSLPWSRPRPRVHWSALIAGIGIGMVLFGALA